MLTMKRKIIGTGSRLAACLMVCVGLCSRTATAQTITLSARSIQPGEIVRVEVQGPAELEGVAASVFGRRIPLEFDRERQVWNTLVGIDLDTKPGLYRMTIGTQVRLLRVVEKKFEVRRLRVAEEFVNPPASAMEQMKARQ